MTNVLCGVVGKHVFVHLPPLDLRPPAPEQWLDYPDLRGACGRRIEGVTAGYGDLAILRAGADIEGIEMWYCNACFPHGKP